MAKAKTVVQRLEGQPASDPNIRIHRRFTGATLTDFPAPTGEVFVGAVVDVETTGLDPQKNAIIELGICTFGYDTTDRIVTIIDSYSALQDPGEPLDPKIVELTGLTDADLKGQAIDWSAVLPMIETCRLFIAHNAKLDRQFVEEHSPLEQFAKRAWACSYNEVDWKKRWPETTAGSLGAVLAGTRREFYEAHRALDDCRAVLRAISTPYEVLEPAPAQRQAFSDLLASARVNTRRIWARGAPFKLKDELKLGRGYHWHDASKTWYYDTQDSAEVARELVWLREHGIVSDEALVTYFGARDRWSKRV